MLVKNPENRLNAEGICTYLELDFVVPVENFAVKSFKTPLEK